VRGGSTCRGGHRAATLAVALAALLVAPVAAADDPRTLRTEAERLRAANQGLAAQSHEALLELYALESRLARAESRLVTLGERAAEVERETERARGDLRLARNDLAESERGLAARLQALYVEGAVDPLAVLLGAQSLDEALEALDGLDRLAADDRLIIEQVRGARERLEVSLARLKERDAELDALLTEAAATRAGLEDARVERTAYLATLRDEQALNAGRIETLLAAAEAAQAEAARIAQPVAAPATAAESSSPEQAVSAPATVASAPMETATPLAASTASGSTLTVASTGYCLRGTTATGMQTGWGTIAVDPAVIPLGTRMSVPGYGDGVAADTGSAVQGNMIDLWFPSCDQALAWGQRTVTITLY
jgi:3D (Asp-Asp-Asp) domain-containing protein